MSNEQGPQTIAVIPTTAILDVEKAHYEANASNKLETVAAEQRAKAAELVGRLGTEASEEEYEAGAKDPVHVLDTERLKHAKVAADNSESYGKQGRETADHAGRMYDQGQEILKQVGK